MPDETKYYVALDLGSETMAAYCEDRERGRGRMVRLQHHAKELHGSNPILVEDGGQPSPRLRTRVALHEKRQPEPLPDAHATLDFLDAAGKRSTGYDQSLFQYFHDESQPFPQPLLPNPKIPFQEGGADIIPEVEVNATGPARKVRYPPEVLLGHLTVQVIRNFLLRAPELEGATPQDVHLILTVPNVYSLVHVDTLLDFIRRQLDLGGLEYLYESDAVAYLLLASPDASVSPDIDRFRATVQNRRDQERLRVATVDIGRGTTDLSLVQVGMPTPGSNKKQHWVLARTGKSDGGNRLTYILARFLNERLVSTYEKHGHEPIWNFLEGKQGKVGSQQGMALHAFEQCIHDLKASIGEKLEIGLSADKQREHIERLLAPLFQAEDANWGTDRPLLETWLEPLHKELLEALVLPPRLPGDGQRWWLSITWLQKLLARFGKGRDLEQGQRLADLAQEIVRYVEDNVTDLLERLEVMAQLRENSLDPKPSRLIRRQVFDPDCTFVVVAGRGSRFAPVQAALRHALGRLNVPVHNVLFLSELDAKEACARGAVLYTKAEVEQRNPTELHGTYGFLNATPMGRQDLFQAVDMTALGNGGSATVTFPVESTYLFIYSPRPDVTAQNTPKIADGTTAIIRSFKGREFVVEYEPETLKIKVNGEEIQGLHTFGHADENIYPKVWPEVVKPTREES